LRPHPEGRSENAEAYQFYLQARFHREQLTKEGTAKAIQFYLQSIHVDPSYALAWAGLSRAYADQAGQNWVPFIEGFRRANGRGAAGDRARAHARRGARRARLGAACLRLGLERR
jgi:hypothetical protein